mgnify:CR=1 FL=1
MWDREREINGWVCVRNMTNYSDKIISSMCTQHDTNLCTHLVWALQVPSENKVIILDIRTHLPCTNWACMHLQSCIKLARMKYIYIYWRLIIFQFGSHLKSCINSPNHITIENFPIWKSAHQYKKYQFEGWDTANKIYFLQSSFTHKMSKGIWIWRCSDHLQILNYFF